jgi:FkbM family methyltransferase
MTLEVLLHLNMCDVRLLFWKLLFTVLPEFELEAPTESGTFRFSSKDHVIGRHLFLERSFDNNKVEKAVQLATRLGCISDKNDGYLIDIGANVGTVSISLVKKGVFSRALAFEPEPKNYGFLVRNIEANMLGRSIRPLKYALSASEGELELELSRENHGDHRLQKRIAESHHSSCRKPVGMSVRVPVRCLDRILETIGIQYHEVKLLWMDVQGHEKYVMEGAEGLIKSGVPVVTEFWPDGLSQAGTSAQAFSRFVYTTFISVYDLSEERPQRRSSSDMSVLFDAYSGPRFTDLLLLSH